MKKTVVCFGEVLWDLFPSGKVAGGAPMNVAVHINNLGIRSQMISRVGKDQLGKLLLDFLKEKGISTDLIQVDTEYKTGVVKVLLDATGQATYEIVEPVAWDFIQQDKRAQAAVSSADAIVFGSLATRNAVTRQTLMEMLELASLKIFDVNLRPPHYSRELLELLLLKTDYVKMNDEELDIISGWYGKKHTEESKLELLKQRFMLSGLIITKGADGAVLLNDKGFFRQSGFPVKVKDTVGSGDAFLAAIITRMLMDDSPASCLEFACATGAFVATFEGGTPPVNNSDIEHFLASQ